ncbi:gamma-glutamylcyclotransferase family protein [Bacillus horti]|uniref:Cation transport regulator ChaC n=1 Tax=Caldalkalibacillus horti TaxID=77523 RepID=A0ABT9VW13_9BACI|nr:gamma-glutamylcyclotransferase family protein [Bacillus horti]MDQ0165188.1 cation transport regulator ChaC [Bacillus horti]
MEKIYYFAYGSCMDQVDFTRTIAEFEVLGSAILKNYRLAFTLYGESRYGGVADVVRSLGDEVQGVLYSFAQEELPHLDQREGVHLGKYERIEVDIHFQGKRVRAYTYQVVDKAQQEIAPSAYYAGLMINGMSKFATEEYKKSFTNRLQQGFGLKL